MTKNIDETDRRILRALQRDAGQSLDVLSDRVGLSRNACWRRVRQLEEAGVIRGRVALIDPAAVGVPMLVLVLIRTNIHGPDWLARFRGAVREMPEIVAAWRVSGELDYMLQVRVADVKGYDAFYQRLIARVEIADVSASFVMEDLKDTTALPL